MKSIVVLLGILLISAILWDCTPKGIPVEKAPSLESQPQTSTKEAWELKWDKTLEAARKEGVVVVYGGSVAANLKLSATSLLKEKFGIDLQVLTGRGSDVITKITSERRAGLFIPDVYASGPSNIYAELKTKGAVDPMEPVLILPEVIDPKGWLDEKHYWGDKDRMVYLWAADPDTPIAINTNMVQPSAIKSYQDLLNPQWKGKIVTNDPTIEGTGLRSFTDMIYNKLVDPDFFRQMVKH